MTILALYIASGGIASNPSSIGGLYACRLVMDDGDPVGYQGVLPRSLVGSDVTNNQADMMALLDGLKRVPVLFNGTVHSKNKVTLGRAFQGWRWRNIPGWMHKLYQEQRSRLALWHEIQYVLADARDEHIKWCERACQQAGEAFLDTIGQNIPTFSELPV